MPSCLQPLSPSRHLSAWGVLATWSPLEGDYQTVTYLGSTLTDNFAFETLGLKAFVDFTYVEASIGLDTSVTNINETSTYLGTSASENFPFSVTDIDIRVVGKYPFDFGSFSLFPLVGLEKYFALSGSFDNVADTSDQISDNSPWFLMAGVGRTSKLRKNFMFGLS